MTATTTPPPPGEPAARRGRAGLRAWLVPAVLLIFAPKCIGCLLAYAGLGAAVGLGRVEICGATPGSMELWMTWVPVAGWVLGTAGFTVWLRRGTGVPTRDSEAVS